MSTHEAYSISLTSRILLVFVILSGNVLFYLPFWMVQVIFFDFSVSSMHLLFLAACYSLHCFRFQYWYRASQHVFLLKLVQLSRHRCYYLILYPFVTTSWAEIFGRARQCAHTEPRHCLRLYPAHPSHDAEGPFATSLPRNHVVHRQDLQLHLADFLQGLLRDNDFGSRRLSVPPISEKHSPVCHLGMRWMGDWQLHDS